MKRGKRGTPEDIGVPDRKTNNGENARMHETNTYAKRNGHDDMIKCNTQANDMEMTANNWQTPGASNPGRYNTPPLTRDLVPRS